MVPGCGALSVAGVLEETSSALLAVVALSCTGTGYLASLWIKDQDGRAP